MELLAQAVTVCRSALEPDLRREFPEQWAILFRTKGANATELLAQAGIAYRSALEVFTPELFPEYCAMIRNKKGLKPSFRHVSPTAF